MAALEVSCAALKEEMYQFINTRLYLANKERQETGRYSQDTNIHQLIVFLVLLTTDC